MTPPVMIRLEVEAMKYHVVHAFNEHQLQITKIIDAELERCLKTIDIEEIIRQECEKVLREGVVRSLGFAISQAFYQEPLKDVFQGVVASKVRESIEKMLGGLK